MHPDGAAPSYFRPRRLRFDATPPFEGGVDVEAARRFDGFVDLVDFEGALDFEAGLDLVGRLRFENAMNGSRSIIFSLSSSSANP